MRARTTWSSSAPGVLERLLAVGGLGERHPHADLSTERAQHRQRRRLLAPLRPKPPAVRGQALAGAAFRRRQKKYESPQRRSRYKIRDVATRLRQRFDRDAAAFHNLDGQFAPVEEVHAEEGPDSTAYTGTRRGWPSQTTVAS
jgi:hypothetical protein